MSKYTLPAFRVAYWGWKWRWDWETKNGLCMDTETLFLIMWWRRSSGAMELDEKYIFLWEMWFISTVRPPGCQFLHMHIGLVLDCSAGDNTVPRCGMDRDKKPQFDEVKLKIWLRLKFCVFGCRPFLETTCVFNNFIGPPKISVQFFVCFQHFFSEKYSLKCCSIIA